MEEESHALPLQVAKTPRIIFVTGGPGTGKGTQCAKLVEELGFKHVSIGDLVRAEIKKGSEIGQSIESITKQGNLVPKEVVVGLLAQALGTIKAHTLLIDGFPRDIQQAAYLEQLGVRVDYILHYEADDDEVLLRRLVERGKTSGRADDTEEVITHRFRVYKAESLPVLQLYEPFGVIRKVSCMGTISEVFSRTVRRLRPDVLCVLGPVNSGKTSIVDLLSLRQKYRKIDFNAIKSAKPSASDEDLVKILVKKLAALKKEYRVIIDDFPQNLTQARYFATLSGDPEKVLYMHCSKETSQQRQLALGKTENYSSPAQVGVKYLDFLRTSTPLLSYLKTKLRENFIEGNAENDDLIYTQKENCRLLEPEVVVIRGQIVEPFLVYLKEKCGYTLLNATNLLRLWRFARGLSVSTSDRDLSDDPELVPLLRDALYTGAGGKKYAIYNFSLGLPHNFYRFHTEVADIRRVFYLYRSLSGFQYRVPEMEDRVTKDLYCLHKRLEPVPINGVSKTRTLSQEDRVFFQKVLEEGDTRTTAKLLVIEGPVKSGKTTIAKFLGSKFGFRLIDCNVVAEETKKRLSTEDEPKDTLTFTEFAEGLQHFLKENRSETFLFDGFPPPEILTLPGGAKFKDLEAPEAVGEDDDPDYLLTLKAKSLVSRWTLLVQTYLIDSLDTLIQLNCREAELTRRLKVAGEIPEAEELPNDGKNELFESIVQQKYLKAAAPYFPKALQLTRTLGIDSGVLGVQEVQVALLERFDTKVILVRTPFESTLTLFRHLAWKHQAFFLTFQEALEFVTSKNDSLGAKIRARLNDSEDLNLAEKISVVSAFIRDKKRPSSNVVLLCNYPFSLSQSYPRALDELLELETQIGNLVGLVAFTSEVDKEEVFLPDLPVRKRKAPKPVAPPENEETPEISMAESVPQADLEPESPSPQWNDNQATNLTMAFQYFKGQEAQCVCESLKQVTPLEHLSQLLEKLWTPGFRWNLQLYTTSDFDFSLSNDLNTMLVTSPLAHEYYESLPIDLTGMGKSGLNLSEIFTNSTAKDFHFKYLKLPTVPFSTFFAYFSKVLHDEGVEVTSGLRRAIRMSIDRSKNGCVTAADVNFFFLLWTNVSKRAEIIAIGQTKEAQKRGDSLGFKLFLVVIDSSPDPLTSASSFKKEDLFIITEAGCPDSKRFCADRCTLAGRENGQFLNDIQFNSADTRLRNSHFSILAKKDGYYLVDHGGFSGVQVHVLDFPMV